MWCPRSEFSFHSKMHVVCATDDFLHREAGDEQGWGELLPTRHFGFHIGFLNYPLSYILLLGNYQVRMGNRSIVSTLMSVYPTSEKKRILVYEPHVYT